VELTRPDELEGRCRPSVARDCITDTDRGRICSGSASNELLDEYDARPSDDDVDADVPSAGADAPPASALAAAVALAGAAADLAVVVESGVTDLGGTSALGMSMVAVLVAASLRRDELPRSRRWCVMQ